VAPAQSAMRRMRGTNATTCERGVFRAQVLANKGNAAKLGG